MSEYSMAKAQRAYDNQTPEDNDPPELPDELYDAYLETEEHSEWMMENAGNGDWVEYEEKHFDLIYEMACEWADQLQQGAMEEKAEVDMEKRRLRDE